MPIQKSTSQKSTAQKFTSQKFTKRSFELLKAIFDNNSKQWYGANKDDFKNNVRNPFADILQATTTELETTATPLIGHEKTMFRQHRDVRFSKSKLPYQTHVSGVLSPSGMKDENTGILYLRLAKDGGMMAAGRYDLDAKGLEPFRRKIVEQQQEFSEILQGLQKAGLGFREDYKLKTMPRGFQDYKNHPHGEYIKLKVFMVIKNLPRKLWLSGDIVPELVWLAKESERLLAFIND